MTQTLFSLVLTADAAATLIDDDPARARGPSWTRCGPRSSDDGRVAVAHLRASPRRAGTGRPRRRPKAVRGARPGPRPAGGGGGRGPDLLAGAELEVHRVVQEALHNAVRHASATAVGVVLAADHIVVTDDGIGFDPADPHLRTRHLGLAPMEERAAAVGGALRIDSAPGAGTTVTLELPPRLTPSGSSWSTTTPWCARACGRSSAPGPVSRSSPRRPGRRGGRSPRRRPPPRRGPRRLRHARHRRGRGHPLPCGPPSSHPLSSCSPASPPTTRCRRRCGRRRRVRAEGRRPS